jgi:hypothetical protein
VGQLVSILYYETWLIAMHKADSACKKVSDEVCHTNNDNIIIENELVFFIL